MDNKNFKINIGINNINIKFFEKYEEENHYIIPSHYTINLNGNNIKSIASNIKTIEELEILALNICITHFSEEIENLQRNQKLFIEKLFLIERS